MSFVGNLFWFVSGGLPLALGWFLLGALMCCTVIGIPFGVAAFRIARFAALPFGKQLIDAEMVGDKRILGSTLVNILWVVLAGFWLAIGHALAGAANLCFFWLVFPIPFGLAHFKLAQASFAPLGKRIVSNDLADAAKNRHANALLDRKFAAASR